MNDSGKAAQNATPISTAVDITTRLGGLLLMVFMCFQILKPFISLMVWGVILSVAVFPVYQALNTRLGDRRKLAAAILIISALLVIILPAIQLAVSSVDGLKALNVKMADVALTVPPPSKSVQDWPVIGEHLYNAWQQASVNLTDTLKRFEPQLTACGKWLLTASVDTIFGVLKFAASLIVAGILMATAASGGQVTRNLFRRLAGERGAELAIISEKTIRGVVKGILGVAVLQAVMAGVGFALAGIPAAGVWAFLCLFLAIVQIGITPVVLVVIIYAFMEMSTLPAVLLTVYLIAVTIGDGPLKAILLGRGALVPMPVIFLGAIGGFIWIGFLGLFIGAVMLSLGYKLFEAWLGEGMFPEREPEMIET